jgi:diguanylate cyclase (GGDEF)-like protein
MFSGNSLERKAIKEGPAEKLLAGSFLLLLVIVLATFSRAYSDFARMDFPWKTYLPGTMIGDRILILLLTCTALLSITMALKSRQIVRSLVESEAHAKKMARHDLLSGLPNRFLFNELINTEIARCSRKNTQFALFYLDLDRFKETNDTFGHDAGDRLLKAVTERITKVLRCGDPLARIGGDEFAILQTQVRDPRDCVMLANRILDAMAAPFDLGEQQVFAGVSIGIALYPQNANERQALMRLADFALYRAKHEGRNRFAFFEAKMGEQLRLRKTVEDELQAAITDSELRLLYQPIVSTEDQKMVGVEALVRWHHPTQGLLSPDSFIALAEERGLILPLGEWVLRKACTDALRWPSLRIAINVSPVQFRHKDFVASIERILEETGIEPQRLELELTEGVIVTDADLAEKSIMDLRATGIKMALDDFGTGYSSLIYLRRFAFDKIKIDRSFLLSLEPTGEGAIIVESIVHLGRALGLTVTAEGIETEEQVDFLKKIGCDELQGYYFSVPVSSEEINTRLMEEARDQSRKTSILSVA